MNEIYDIICWLTFHSSLFLTIQLAIQNQAITKTNVNWTPGNQFLWNLKHNIQNTSKENVFENVICKMSAILFRTQYIKPSVTAETRTFQARSLSWLLTSCRADSRHVLSQWETSLQSNSLSHWLGPNLESALSCRLSSRDHLQLWCWLCMINRSLPFMGSHFKYMCHQNMEDWNWMQLTMFDYNLILTSVPWHWQL